MQHDRAHTQFVSVSSLKEKSNLLHNSLRYLVLRIRSPKSTSVQYMIYQEGSYIEKQPEIWQWLIMFRTFKHLHHAQETLQTSM